MNDRRHDSPMDFEWDKPGGPSDINSPLHPANIQAVMARKRHLDSPMASPSKGVPQMLPPNNKPILFNTPVAQPHFRSAAPTPVPAPQFNPVSSAFTTPRKSTSTEIDDSPMAGIDVDFDSLRTDIDTDTPPHKLARQKSTSNGIFSSMSISKRSGRGELSSRPKYSDAAYKMVQKRRYERHGRHTSSSSDSDPDTPRGPRSYSHEEPPRHASWADTHRDIPTILSQYLQLFINLLIGSLGLYILFSLVRTIQHDVDKKVLLYIAEVQHEIEGCHSDWMINGCMPDKIVPHMKSQCDKWELCAARNAEMVGRARVSAETFAEIINSFIEPISYKTMFFCFILLFGCIFISNFAFGFFRAKTMNHPHPIIAAAAPPIASLAWPQTPSHQLHQGYQYGAGFETPYATPAMGRMVEMGGGATGTVGKSKGMLGWR